MNVSELSRKYWQSMGGSVVPVTTGLGGAGLLVTGLVHLHLHPAGLMHTVPLGPVMNGLTTRMSWSLRTLLMPAPAGYLEHPGEI